MNKRIWDIVLKWGLYFQSMSLLFVLLAIATVRKPEKWVWSLIIGENIVPLFCVCCLLVAVITLSYFRYWCKGAVPEDKCVSVNEVKDMNADIIGFLLSAILPLSSVGMTPCRGCFFISVVVYAIGKMSVNSPVLATNPSLLLLGYNIYQVRLSDESEKILISKDVIYKDCKIYRREINKAVIFGGVR